MDVNSNYPLPTRKRIFHAAACLQRFGEYGDEPYSRSFDNCFEMGDSNEVVKGLIELAETEPYLARGIHYLGGTVLDEWIAQSGIDEETANSIRKRAGTLHEITETPSLTSSLAAAFA